MGKKSNRAKEVIEWLVEKVLGSRPDSENGSLIPIPIPVKN